MSCMDAAGHLYPLAFVYRLIKFGVSLTPLPISPINQINRGIAEPLNRFRYSNYKNLRPSRVSNLRHLVINPLTPNDLYMSRTAPLTSKRCILYIYSTNIGTEYFKHALNSPFFFSSKCSLFHNANLFGSCIIHILFTGCAKIKKK